MSANHTYGTIDANNHAENGLLNGADAERAALLQGKTDKQDTILARLRRHMNRNIRKDWGDFMLLGCYIITGLLDSSSTQVWGSFVSMQTGNTIYVGLGLAAPWASTRWIRAGISVTCFCLGSFFFARYHRHFGQRKRWVMVSAYIIQLLMIVIPALMSTFGPKTGTSGPVTVWVGLPLALIAFQSAGQAVTSRVLSYGGLTSVVLTSIYCDLFSDAKLFASFADNVERNRRAAAPAMVLVGALFGGLLSRSEWGIAGALWTAVILKSLVIVGWFIWRADPEQ